VLQQLAQQYRAAIRTQPLGTRLNDKAAVEGALNIDGASPIGYRSFSGGLPVNVLILRTDYAAYK
jgi:hypothetical protein